MILTITLLWLIVPLAIAITWHLWPLRRNASVRFLHALLIGTGGWCLLYSAEILAATERAKLVWAMAQYPFIGILPVAWVGLAVTLRRNGRPPSRGILAALAVVPIATLALVLTNDLHHLIWRSHQIESLGALQLLVVEHGVGFWIFDIYCLGVVGVGLLSLMWLGLTSRSLGAAQRVSLLVAALLPAVGNLLYTLKIGPLPGLDLTPLSFAMSVVAVSQAARGRGIVNVVLLARDTVLEQLPEAVFVLNDRNEIVDANVSARALASRFALGKSLEEVLPFLPSDWLGAKAVENGLVIEHVGDDGKRRSYRVQGIRLRQGDGEPAGEVAIVSDITAQEHINRRLEAARAAAEAANKAKSQFLANMSHEIRTPMNGVLGMAQLLQQEDTLSEDARSYVETIMDSGTTLMAILNDILDIAKAESGKLSLDLSTINPREIADEVCALYRAQVQSKGLTFDHAVADNVPLSLHADGVRVRQVLMNLLNNAIKFTAKGGVSLHVDWVHSETTNGHVLRIAVSDTGIGIAKDQQEKIFASFEQVDASISRRFGGTGLGLSIVKQLAELMGGSVSVNSELGRGTTFTVDLALPES